MGNLTKNFSTWEFACKCCGNHPAPEALKPLAEALQKLRDLITAERGVDTPVKVTSGYRCPNHNRAVGGKPGSQHVLGKAADIQVKGLTPDDLAKYARRIPEFHGIGIYRSWVHADVGDRVAHWKAIKQAA